MVEALWTFVWYCNALVLGYFIAISAVYFLTSLVAFRALRNYVRRLHSLDTKELIASAGAPPITLLVPAYNEEATCVESTRSFLTLEYPEYEVLVVNDGSRDQTLNRLVEAFDLAPAVRAPTAEIRTARIRGIYHSRRYSNLWVIDKENGGKADSLNAGLSFCRTSLFCAMDADSLIEREALVRVARLFLEDGTTVAAGGTIRIVNGCTIRAGIVTDIRLPKNYLARFQVLEYLRAFLAGQMGWSVLNATFVISGAFGVFRRSTVVDAGGYATDTVGEDMELVVRLHRYCRENRIPYRIAYMPDPVAWTECPESTKILGRQRDRWHRGLMETMWRHRRMLFNPRYGLIGLLVCPYFFFLEMLGPIIEFMGYISFLIILFLGSPTAVYIVAFLLVAFVLGVALSLAAVGLEEISFRRYPRTSDLIGLFLLAILENFGYRQLNTYWRIRAVFSKIRGVKGWGKMERKGFATEAKK
ncbi:MAG TPA: glycosyltransferase [bacterium]|nr:glycosyltransferase [bacterium]